VADTETFWSRKQVTDSSSIESWLQNRKKKGGWAGYKYTNKAALEQYGALSLFNVGVGRGPTKFKNKSH